MEWTATANTTQTSEARKLALPEAFKNPSQAEMQARKNAKCCFNCGNKDHMSRNCPFERHSVRLQQAPRVNMAQLEPRMHLDQISETDEELGKD